MSDSRGRRGTYWLKSAGLSAIAAALFSTVPRAGDLAKPASTSSDLSCGASERSIATVSHLRCLEPSDLSSVEFRRFYADFLNRTPPPIPDRRASKAEWDKYDAAAEQFFAADLARVLRRYPVDVVDTKIAGVHVGIVSPREGVALENRDRILINLHGGGFFANRGLTFGQLESAPVAAIGRITIVTLDYREAPFHEYPAASEDVEAVYRELLKQHRAEAIGIFGCSAGGVLAAQSVARLRARGVPRPGAVGVFCSGPGANWVRAPGDSKIWGDPPPGQTVAQQPKQPLPPDWYMENASSNDPLAYPASFDRVISQFPPTLFVSGTRDLAMSAVVTAHAQWLRLNVDSALYIMEGAPHAAHVMAIGTPEAHAANTYIARWFTQRLARSSERTQVE